ncbi:MAG: hypothetical protein KVP17_003839 [Porospora cf. gigantea B]|uniref:uncharacterized protein n=1 Tax=Porospora cf. gigantea B TaxID=2853592 RepID=UPI003571D645|nr:MAG: hypothetical protein KVP17_003839 [Porospora cf. gigantea B]
MDDTTLLSVINLTVDVGVESDTSLPMVFRFGNEALAVSVTNNVIPYISDIYDSQRLCSARMTRDLSSGMRSLSTFAFIDGATQFDRSHLPKMESGSFANGMSQFKHHLFSHFKYLQQHRIVFVFQLFSFVLVMLVYEWTLAPVTISEGHTVTLLGPYPGNRLPADATIVPAAKDFKCSPKIMDRLGLKLHRVDDVSSYLAKGKRLHVMAFGKNTFWHNSQIYTWAYPAAWAVHYVCTHNMVGWPTLKYTYFNRPQSDFLGLLLTVGPGRTFMKRISTTSASLCSW